MENGSGEVAFRIVPRHFGMEWSRESLRCTYFLTFRGCIFWAAFTRLCYSCQLKLCTLRDQVPAKPSTVSSGALQGIKAKLAAKASQKPKKVQRLSFKPLLVVVSIAFASLDEV